MAEQETKTKTKKVSQDIPTFNTYIDRVFKDNYDNFSLTTPANDQLNQLLVYMIKYYREMATKLILNLQQATVTDRQIVTVTRTLFLNQVERWDREVSYVLVKGMVDYGREAINKFRTTEKGRFKERTGLNIPYSRVTKIFTEEAYYHKSSSFRIGSGSMVMLTGVMEKLLQEIYRGAVEIVQEDNRKQVKPRDIFLAYRQDPILTRAIEGELRVRMTDVGAEPFLSWKLVPVTEEQKKKMKERRRKLAEARRKRKQEKKEEKKGKSTLPGKKALREIKEHQKSTSLLLTPTNIKNLIRKIAESNLAPEEEGSEKIILGKDAINLIHYVLEDELIKLFRDAMVLDDRTIIGQEHLRLIRAITEDVLLKTKADFEYLIPGKYPFEEGQKLGEKELKEQGTVEDYILSITSNSITRVARRAGVASLNKEALTEARTVIYHIVNTVVLMALESRVDRKAVKIQLKDVEYALRGLNLNYTYASPPKKTKTKKKEE